MAKLTLLEIVQDILNDMDSDEVNSIDDTIESQQVAQIVKTTYNSMMSNRDWPHTRKTIQLVPFGNNLLPTFVTVPESVKELSMINYNCNQTTNPTKRMYVEMKWLEPDEFLRMCNTRDSTSTSVDTIYDTSGTELFIVNNKPPKYYTSFNDSVLVFDAYDKSIETSLQQSKFQSYAYVFPEWEHTDTAVPDLPEEAFSALVEEAKSKAMFKLRQMVDNKAEQEASRQNRWLSRKAWKVNGGIKFPNYGRK